MSITLVEAWREKQRVKWIVKFLLRRVAQPCVLVVLAYVFPKLAIFYAICGLYHQAVGRLFRVGRRWRADDLRGGARGTQCLFQGDGPAHPLVPAEEPQYPDGL